MNRYTSILFVLLAITSCTKKLTVNNNYSKPIVSVTLPIEKYFIDRLADTTIMVNVIIPQNVGHSEYTPKPSQIMAVAKSDIYLAIGHLDFENAWKERLTNGTTIKWIDLDKGINLIENAEHSGHHATDPHYWLSPKRVSTMIENIANELRPLTTFNVDSAKNVLLAEIDLFDKKLNTIKGDKAFLIYHPALTYLAHDYSLTQLEIEKDGNAPSPITYKNSIDEARKMNVKIVFVQQGYDIDKAQSAADMIGAKVVTISPENYKWHQTMQTIVDALAK